jgi:hypothetical protein
MIIPFTCSNRDGRKLDWTVGEGKKCCIHYINTVYVMTGIAELYKCQTSLTTQILSYTPALYRGSAAYWLWYNYTLALYRGYAAYWLRYNYTPALYRVSAAYSLGTNIPPPYTEGLLLTHWVQLYPRHIPRVCCLLIGYNYTPALYRGYAAYWLRYNYTPALYRGYAAYLLRYNYTPALYRGYSAYWLR